MLTMYLGLEMMREIRQTCFMASSNSTRSMTAFVSLYSFSACTDQYVSLQLLYCRAAWHEVMECLELAKQKTQSLAGN